MTYWNWYFEKVSSRFRTDVQVQIAKKSKSIHKISSCFNVSNLKYMIKDKNLGCVLLQI